MPMSSKALNTKEDKLSSPCVRNCCLDQQDICLGCFRTLEEITGWQQMNRAEQQATLARCQQRKQQRGNLGISW